MDTPPPLFALASTRTEPPCSPFHAPVPLYCRSDYPRSRALTGNRGIPRRVRPSLPQMSKLTTSQNRAQLIYQPQALVALNVFLVAVFLSKVGGADRTPRMVRPESVSPGARDAEIATADGRAMSAELSRSFVLRSRLELLEPAGLQVVLLMYEDPPPPSSPGLLSRAPW